MMTLFWSLFDLMDLDNLMIDPSLRFTETVGTMMYVCFSVVGVVVLVNALIAMMSNTYTRVEVKLMLSKATMSGVLRTFWSAVHLCPP